MSAKTSIEWTDTTWNPVAGCSMASPGCTNCYAMRMAGRLEAMGQQNYQGLTRKSGGRSVWTGKVKIVESALKAPLHWRSPRLVFVNSMSDLFQKAVPQSFVEDVWNIMGQTPRHRYQILTKRPDMMADCISRLNLKTLPNVWLGTSVESIEYLNRIDILRKIPASVRFVSFEPLIGSVGRPDLEGIDWAIVGGESGPESRPINVQWVDDIKYSCDEFFVSFFFKQWGGANKKKNGREYLGKTWSQFPISTRREASLIDGPLS